MRCIKTIRQMFLSMFFCAACNGYNTFPRELSKGIDDPIALKALIDAGQTVDAGKYRIVDVRSKEKFAEGHIPTAMNIPNGILKYVRQTPPENGMIIVYCENRGSAQMAAQLMAKSGFTNIYNWGGFENWTLDSEK